MNGCVRNLSRNLSRNTGRPPRAPGERTARRGMVIVIVSVVIILVSLAGYGFLALMESENMAARARGDQMQAASVASSGREYLAAVLESPRSVRPQEGETSDLPDVFGPIVVDGEETEQADDESVRRGRFCIVVGTHSEMAESVLRRGYVNESAKLNLVELVRWDRRSPGSGQMTLMNLPGMDESTADAILDWIDSDNVPRAMGAEAEYYSELTPPRQPRNGPPLSLEELLLVRGVTRERLFGIDLNANFRIDDWEAALADQQAEAAAPEDLLPWSHFLTVYSGERDETMDGRPRIQLNQSDLGKLHVQLGAAVPAAWANFIVAYRQYGRSRGRVRGQEIEASEFAPDLSKRARFPIRSPLDLIGVRVVVPQKGQRSDSSKSSKKSSGSKKSRGSKSPKSAKSAKSARNSKKPKIITSPFTKDPSQMREYLPRLMDAVTVGRGRPVFGRVNINLAPREVLLGVPGIDVALAEGILAARTLTSAQEDSRLDPTWLLVEGLVDLTRMRRLLPYVTTGGDVGRAQIIGFYDLRSPIMRFETVIDATDRPARQVYYKDLRRLGRGPLSTIIETATIP